MKLERTKHQSKSKPRQWPNVYSRIQRSGQASYIVDLGLNSGKRERRSFKTKGEADSYAELKRTERKNQGATAVMLPNETRLDAIKAERILKSHGVSLATAAQYYFDHVIAYKNAPVVSEIVEKMVADAENNKRRDRTVTDLKNRLTKFADDFPNARLSEITLEEIKDWLDDWEDWSPRSKINYLTKISQLYNYAIRNCWVDANLIERIDRPEAEDKEPGIFSVEQAAKLLEFAPKHGLLYYIALGFFAGLRSAELLRLEPEAILMSERSIVVGATVAKKRSRRVVEMCDSLMAWFEKYPLPKNRIVDAKDFRANLEALKTEAEVTQWPHNGLRHSFGSYHLAKYGDAIKTAGQMGHRDANVVHNHYKALILKSEAEKFWSLKPKSA
jgi:integrase